LGWAVLWLAQVATAQPLPDRIVLLETGDPGVTEPGLDELQLYIEAALSPFPVRVEYAPVPNSPGDAEEIAAQTDVLAVVWTAVDHGELTFLVPALGAGAISRPVSAASATARFEIMSAILLSELMPVLVDVFGQPPPISPPVVAEPEIVEAPDIVEEPPTQPRLAVRFLISGAYLAVPLLPDHGYLSGLGLGLGVGLGPHLHITAGLDLLQPAEIALPGSPAEIQRWPIRLCAALVLPAGPLDLGPTFSGLAEIWRVNKLDYEPVDPEALEAKRNLGIAIAFRSRVRFAPWFAVYAEAGVDLFFAVDQVVYEDQVLLRRGQVQPRIAVGVMGEIGR